MWKYNTFSIICSVCFTCTREKKMVSRNMSRHQAFPFYYILNFLGAIYSTITTILTPPIAIVCYSLVCQYSSYKNSALANVKPSKMPGLPTLFKVSLILFVKMKIYQLICVTFFLNLCMHECVCDTKNLAES